MDLWIRGFIVHSTFRGENSVAINCKQHPRLDPRLNRLYQLHELIFPTFDFVFSIISFWFCDVLLLTVWINWYQIYNSDSAKFIVKFIRNVTWVLVDTVSFVLSIRWSVSNNKRYQLKFMLRHQNLWRQKKNRNGQFFSLTKFKCVAINVWQVMWCALILYLD